MVQNVSIIVIGLSLILGTVSCTDDDSTGSTCGNGLLEGSEVCDGTDLGGATCEQEGYTGGAIACNAACDGYDTSQCSNAECGNGLVEGSEACDDQDLNETTCSDLGYDGGELACAGDCRSFDTAGCCADGCEAEGVTRCAADVLQTCEAQTSGCLQWTDTDCTAGGAICDESRVPALCRVPCDDECVNDGEALCLGGTLSLCSDINADGCLELTMTDCLSTSGNICDDSQVPAVCAPNGSGDSCLDAFVIQDGSATLSGTDFTADFSNEYLWNSSTNCTGSYETSAEVVFRVDLDVNDTVMVRESGGLDTVLRVVPDDGAGCVSQAECLVSADLGIDESRGVVYEATTAETVWVVVEAFSSDPTPTDYDIRVEVIPQVCGDGYVSPGEQCDDGNLGDGDGCSATCTIEAGYTCVGTTSFCYPTGTGDVCGAGTGGPAILLGPGTYAFDTTGFGSNYDYYDGACGTSLRGAGPDAIFAVDVPAGDILEIHDTDSVGFDAAVVIATDCADIAGTCAAYNDTVEEVSWTNTTGQNTTVYVIIDGYYTWSEGMFQFTLDISTP